MNGSAYGDSIATDWDRQKPTKPANSRPRTSSSAAKPQGNLNPIVPTWVPEPMDQYKQRGPNGTRGNSSQGVNDNRNHGSSPTASFGTNQIIEFERDSYPGDGRVIDALKAAQRELAALNREEETLARDQTIIDKNLDSVKKEQESVQNRIDVLTAIVRSEPKSEHKPGAIKSSMSRVPNRPRANVPVDKDGWPIYEEDYEQIQ